MKKRKDSGQLTFNFVDENELEQLRNQNNHLKSELDQMRAEFALVLADNHRLKEMIKTQTPQPVSIESDNFMQYNIQVTKRSTIEEKIGLYRSYFKGRDDVYAVRSNNKTGKSEYYPKREYLGKHDGKHVWGENLPLTDAVIRDHLQKEDPPVTVGIYPLLLDETCWFLALDFDNKTWQEDALAFLETCREYAVPASLERSRSGNGGHVWIFFEESIPAKTARMMGSALLTITLEKRNDIGFKSYDRMFPNQDTLPRGKSLGNLIALPLQRLAGKEGHSLFVDEHMEPYPDQWIFISSIRKMKRSEVEAVVQQTEQHGSLNNIIDPFISENEIGSFWSKVSINDINDELPTAISAVISDMIYIQKEGLPSQLLSYFARMGAFQNPEFYRKQRMRLNTSQTPRIIDCTENSTQHLALPRGCLDEIKEFLESSQIEFNLQDERNTGSEMDVQFHGELRDRQKEAVRQIMKYDTGTLSATTAFGKTVVGIWMIASRKTSTLILVNSKQLMEQWRSQISIFLNLSKEEIGQIGAGKNIRTGRIDVAMLQSLHRKDMVKDYITDYGHVIVDECHHVSAFSFEKVLKHAKAKYVLGLTATLVRKDGHHPIVLMQCGPIRFRVNARSEAEARPFEHFVIPRRTQFVLPEADGEVIIQKITSRLIEDGDRNDLIFDDLLKTLDQGRSPLLLTDRTSHLEYFQRRLQGFAKNIIVLRGGMGTKKWKKLQDKIHSIPDHEERVLLATGKFAGEGFDDARLDTLFLVTPISGRSRIHQYAGRLHRLHHAKREVQIYDYIDDQVSVLKRMYDRRRKGYLSLGYMIKYD